MAIESFFIHIKLTDKDKDAVERLVKCLEDEKCQYFIPDEKVKEIRQKEEEGTKKVLEWLKTI